MRVEKWILCVLYNENPSANRKCFHLFPPPIPFLSFFMTELGLLWSPWTTEIFFILSEDILFFSDRKRILMKPVYSPLTSTYQHVTKRVRGRVGEGSGELSLLQSLSQQRGTCPEEEMVLCVVGTGPGGATWLC